ncbi:MAG: glycosyltransferase family A protein [Casimicrobiaceae bacterium]
MSVVIPAFNAAWCVGRAIDSVLAQTYHDYEIIVVDDGSTDETPGVLQGYGAQLRVVTKPNGGLSSARNAGIAAARGTYVAFLDADDRWIAQKLERQVALMDADTTLAFCSTAARVETPDGVPLVPWRCGACTGSPLEAIFTANGFVAGSGSAVLVRRDALLLAGPFDEKLRSLEDVDMWMRLAKVGGYACLDKQLAIIFKRPDSMSRQLDVMRSSAIAVMRKNRHLLPAELKGSFWRGAYAAMLSDYAKWAYREGRRGQALRDVATVLITSPWRRGRLALGLFAVMALGRRL